MRLRGALVALAVLLLGVTPAEAAPAAVPVLVIDGRGFGHGVGMAQDGAYWMARAGSTTPQILAHFYPGTGIGKLTGPNTVRVAVRTDPGQDADVLFPTGGEVRDAATGQQSAGFPVAVRPGETVHLRYDATQGRYTVFGGAPRPDPNPPAPSTTSSPPATARAQAVLPTDVTTST